MQYAIVLFYAMFLQVVSRVAKSSPQWVYLC